MLPFSQLNKTVPIPIGRGYIENPQTLGNHIRNRRLKLKMSQKELAKLFGVKKKTIYVWETNKEKPFDWRIPEIVRFLGYDPGLILTEASKAYLCR